MNKVIAVNLNGNAYQLEEAGFDTLNAYLARASAALEGNPDRGEILGDIEQAIADKFRATLSAHRTVVATSEVERVIAEMGPVASDAAAGAPSPAATAASPQSNTPRRLFIIKEGAMIGGVCNGIAAYFGVDVSIVRVLFAVLTMAWGAGLLAYVVLFFIIPTASTPEEKASAQGLPKTAQDFIHRAKEGYYEGIRTWGDRQAHREWRRKFKRDMKAWGNNFSRECRGAAEQWNWRWRTHAAAPGMSAPSAVPVDPGPAIAVPFLALVDGLLHVLLVLGILSLLMNRGLLWYHVPAATPLWVGIAALIVIFHFVVWPVRAARHACLYASGYRGRSWRSPFESLAGLLAVALGLWWANGHVPAVHRALAQVPPMAQQALDGLRDWWHSHGG